LTPQVSKKEKVRKLAAEGGKKKASQLIKPRQNAYGLLSWFETHSLVRSMGRTKEGGGKQKREIRGGVKIISDKNPAP